MVAADPQSEPQSEPQSKSESKSDPQSDPVLPDDHTGDYSRINPYAPPCLGRKCACQRACEHAWCCRAVGRIGLARCSTPQARTVRSNFFFSIFSISRLVFVLFVTMNTMN